MRGKKKDKKEIERKESNK
ncbi:hypothetical protein [Spiroplasma citri]|nr:hypothetical protein [Spiroplasma citri]